MLASGLLWSLVGVFAVLVVLFVVGSPWAGAQVNNEPTGVPTVSGTVRVGEKLTVDVSGIADTDGLNNADFQYQWYANDGTYQVGTASSSGGCSLVDCRGRGGCASCVVVVA